MEAFVGIGPIHVRVVGGEPAVRGRRERVAARRRCEAAPGVGGGEPVYRKEMGGRIELVIGPMFAGKTTELLRRCRERRLDGQKVLLLKSDKDTRYADTEVVTHDRRREPCLSVQKLTPLLADDKIANFDVAAIDEAQFFPDLVEFCRVWADRMDRAVIVAGLDADCERRKFGQVADLLPHVDEVSKLTASCGVCGRPASFTERIVQAKGQIVVGGSELYRPVCRHHWKSSSEALRVEGKHVVPVVMDSDSRNFSSPESLEICSK